MSRRLFRKFLLLLVGALVIALGITLFTTTQAVTTFYYAVTDLGSLSDESLAYDINDSGQVVGYSGKKIVNYSIPPSGAGYMKAVLWKDDTITDLWLVGSINYASGINNVGQVVCSTAPNGHLSGRCPYMWQNGNVTYIGECGGSRYVSAINDAGQVAGWDLVKQPFVWQNGTITYLSTLGGPYSYNSRALDINNRGQVVGRSFTDAESGEQHAVLWNNGIIRDLGTLPGGHNSQAESINKYGKIVGWSDTSSEPKHAVLWQNRQISDLGTIDGNATLATDINNRGTVVGYSFTVNNYNEIPVHAFVWKNGIMRDLNTLLPANSGWELNTAYGINNQGQIVGSGQKNGQTRAFLLTPTWITNIDTLNSSFEESEVNQQLSL